MLSGTEQGIGEIFLNQGVLGAVILVLMFCVAWLMRQWLKSQESIDELRKEQLKDAKEQVAISIEMKNAMQASTIAMQANTNAIQNLQSRGG